MQDLVSTQRRPWSFRLFTSLTGLSTTHFWKTAVFAMGPLKLTTLWLSGSACLLNLPEVHWLLMYQLTSSLQLASALLLGVTGIVPANTFSEIYSRLNGSEKSLLSIWLTIVIDRVRCSCVNSLAVIAIQKQVLALLGFNVPWGSLVLCLCCRSSFWGLF